MCRNKGDRISQKVIVVFRKWDVGHNMDASTNCQKQITFSNIAKATKTAQCIFYTSIYMIWTITGIARVPTKR